ncbi:enoyl-CoA delta isomerase 1, mitochondrial-like [Rhopalosiphum padi]|uniref:enoyl-CoA delta isomerase 1, mitochondrial-like n=1 Tax=Rhopalosiphum padi TaxID=40932 RepID=UPI00298D6AE8|nr:enoyl-CoA delta isomerase 1, mitochondrial-like [Rhopalosiphum padi]
MLKRYIILYRTNKLVNSCRHVSQSMLQSTVDEKTGIVTMTMNNPPVNCISLELLNEINTQINTLRKDNIRGMILTSGLKKVFCGGLDIAEFYKPNPDRLAEYLATLHDTWISLYMTSFPTVSVINGHSLGGGCLIAMGCDYRVMIGPHYTIGLNETKLGVVPPKWFQDTMVAVIGQRKAEVSMTTGKIYTTDEALKIGLVDESSTDIDSALKKGTQFLNNFENISPWAFKMTKNISRQPTIQLLIDNKQKDFDFVYKYMQTSMVQKSIGLYLQSLKKK